MEATDFPKWYECDRFEVIQKDGKVWIDDTSGLIARYNPITGIDVHSKDTCDDCRSNAVNFNIFVSSMEKQHQIDLTHLINNQNQ